MKKYLMPVLMLALFEMIAVTLWLTKYNFDLIRDMAEKLLLQKETRFIDERL